MDWPRFTAGYVLFIATLVVGAAALARLTGQPYKQAVWGFSSVLFLAAAGVAPRGLLYRVVRNTGWFAGVEHDRTMQRILVGIAGLLMAVYVWDMLD